MHMKFFTERNLIFILLILHLVGISGILVPQTKSLVLSLSFLNLLIGFCLLLVSVFKNKYSFLFFMGIAFVFGFGSELIGVHTGLLFGNYTYGSNLGPKLFAVPLIIGINWGVLSVTSASLTESFKINNFIKATLNSLIMVLFDFLMEPVAMKSDFWAWQNDDIPIYNFICWFLISLILQLIYLFFFKFETNKVFKALFLIQLVFFLLLNIF